MSRIRPARSGLLLQLLLLALAAVEWKGYRFGGSHHAIQVPFVEHLARPALFASDPLLRCARIAAFRSLVRPSCRKNKRWPRPQSGAVRNSRPEALPC